MKRGRRIKICLDILCFYHWFLSHWKIVFPHLLKKNPYFISQKNVINLDEKSNRKLTRVWINWLYSNSSIHQKSRKEVEVPLT